MRILTTLLLTLATMLPCFGATTWPAATNAPNTFFQTNRFLKQVTFGNPATNIIADSGSSINGVGFTNNTVYGDGSGLTGIPLGALPAGVLTNNYATAVTFNDDLTLGTAASDFSVGGTSVLTGGLSVGTNLGFSVNQSGNTMVGTNAWDSGAVAALQVYQRAGPAAISVRDTVNSCNMYLNASAQGSARPYIGTTTAHPFYFVSKNIYRGGISTLGGISFGAHAYNVDAGSNNVIVEGILTATNGLYYFPQTNGLVQAMTNITPVHAWGCMMGWGTNLINGGAGTYAPVTNNPSFCTARTNSFGADIAGGVLTNLIAGFYRVAIHLSGVSEDNSAVVEGDLLLNGVERDEVSFITAFDNPPRIKDMSAFGRLYITNNTPITFQIKSSGANGVTVYRAQMDVGP